MPEAAYVCSYAFLGPSVVVGRGKSIIVCAFDLSERFPASVG